MAKVMVAQSEQDVFPVTENLSSQWAQCIYLVRFPGSFSLSCHKDSAQVPSLYCAWFSGWCKTQTSVSPGSLLRSWGKHSWEQSHWRSTPQRLSTLPLAIRGATSFRNARLSAGVCIAGSPSWEEYAGNVKKKKVQELNTPSCYKGWTPNWNISFQRICKAKNQTTLGVQGGGHKDSARNEAL